MDARLFVSCLVSGFFGLASASLGVRGLVFFLLKSNRNSDREVERLILASWPSPDLCHWNRRPTGSSVLFELSFLYKASEVRRARLAAIEFGHSLADLPYLFGLFNCLNLRAVTTLLGRPMQRLTNSNI